MTSGPAVLWDIDGTLIDSEPLHVRSLEQVLIHNGIVPPDDLHRRTIGRPSREIFDVFAAETTLRTDFEEWTRIRYDYYLSNVPHVGPRGEAVTVFRRLRDAGIPQAFFSNADRVLVNANLKALGLAHPAHVTISRNDVSLGKPHPEGYLRAAERLAVAPENCLVIEDSPTGAAAGLAAGMSVLAWPDMASDWPEGVTIISDITELLAHPAIAGVVTTIRT